MLPRIHVPGLPAAFAGPYEHTKQMQIVFRNGLATGLGLLVEPGQEQPPANLWPKAVEAELKPYRTPLPALQP